MKGFKLDNEPKIASGWKTPDGYFDDFESKITERLSEKETPVIPLLSRRKTWLYAVAAVFVIGFSIPLVNSITTSNSDIDNATLENYLIDHTNLSDEDIAEQLNEEDLQKIKVDLNIEDKELEDLLTTDCNIEEYIN